MRRLIHSTYLFLTCRYLKNPFLILNGIYFNVLIICLVISVAFSLSGNTEASNKVFTFGAYSFGILILNSIVMATYNAFTDRDLLDNNELMKGNSTLENQELVERMSKYIKK